MKIRTVQAGYFKLDGGAMFGVVPKKLWHKLNPPDENNMCSWSTTCLLAEFDDRKVLVDTGLGDKQDEKFRSHFEPHGDDDLLNSIAKSSFKPEDITDIFLTHFHFDHVGGAVKRTADGKLIPTFPNAIYWSNEVHYEWAFNPNARERASFLKENFVPLKEAGVLMMIDVEEGVEWAKGINLSFVDGHTEKMMLPTFELNGRKAIFCADLIPSSYHVGLPYIMAYDVRPLQTLKEKTKLLERAADENLILIFEHDPKTEAATVHRNERGRIEIKESGSLEEVLNKA